MNKRAALFTFSTLMAALAVASAVSAQSADPWFGTWKANVEKSKYSLGPPPKSFVLKLEPSEGGLRQTLDLVDPQGQTVHVETIGKFDGKDYLSQGPPPPGSPAAAKVTNTFRRIDDRAYETVVKVDGNVFLTIRTVHSADGKTSTSTVTGKDGHGQIANDTVVWDRQ
jgi:hypothetical protein